MITVYTFKAPGLLSRLAHDLVLEVDPLVSVSRARIEVRCTVTELRVRGKVVRGGVERVSHGDRREIEATLCAKVIDAALFPNVDFEGEVFDGEGRGTLTMAGQTLALVVPYTVAEGRAHGAVELVPSRWGVKPYTALFGQLKLQDRVRVEFDVPFRREL